MDARIRSPLIVIRRSVGSVAGRDFPSPLRRLLLGLGITPSVCPPHRPDTNAYVERYHSTYGQECLQIHRPSTLQEVCQVTEAFLQHYNEERPREAANLWQGPASGGLSALAYLTRSRHLRVDPHAWLTPLDRKMYLRHVGRDGGVDLDLATYSIGPQLAGRPVLLQVIAENRQFAVWHQDQVVKLLAIKGLVGQEMALSDYLKYIHGCPAALFRPWAQESPTTSSLGRRSLIAFFPSSSARFLRRLPRIRASAGQTLFVCRAKTHRNQKPSATWAALASDGTLLLFTPCFFLPPTSAFPSKTPAVSMRLLSLK
jgi:Integrase core domain